MIPRHVHRRRRRASIDRATGRSAVRAPVRRAIATIDRTTIDRMARKKFANVS
jgi:hypothetical protein